MYLVCVYDGGTYCIRAGRRKSPTFGKGLAYSLADSPQPCEGELEPLHESDRWYVGRSKNGVVVIVHQPTGNLLYGDKMTLLLPATDATIADAFCAYARTLPNTPYAKLVGPLNGPSPADVAGHVQSLTDDTSVSRSGNIEFCIPPAAPTPGVMWRKFSGETWEIRQHETFPQRAALVHKRTDVWIVVCGAAADGLLRCDTDEECFSFFRNIVGTVPPEKGQAIFTTLTAVSYALGFSEALTRAEKEIGDQIHKLKGE